jgi:hypothetical protein
MFWPNTSVLNITQPPAVMPAALAATTQAAYDLQCPTLLQPSRQPGLNMIIYQFCTQYELGPAIEEKFMQNSYTNVRMLRFLTCEELKEIKFKLGEIEGLRDAIERWSGALVTYQP